MAICEQRAGALRYLTAQGIAAPHCFTTRLGGVSTGAQESLNLGYHREPSRENVIGNFAILGRALGFRPEDVVSSTQVHGDTVLQVGRAQQGQSLFREPLPPCDGLITNEGGVALAVFTADCTPILLHDPVTGAVGACHAGWRGTALGIAAKTVAAMVAAFGCRPEDLRAAIGPNIAQCCFETDADVPEAMLAALGPRARAYFRPRGEKFHGDLKGLNRLWLEEAGVRHIEVSQLCTACHPELFWSHRRTGLDRGSQGAIILCKEG